LLRLRWCRTFVLERRRNDTNMDLHLSLPHLRCRHGFASMGFRCGVLIAVLLTLASVEQYTALGAAELSYDAYGKCLKAYVDDRGLVDYQGLKENSKALEDFVSTVSRLDRRVYEGWSEKEKIAFWINVYNALTLKTITDRYPIQASFLGSFVYPGNSIRQIPGVWDRLTFSVMGTDMTLDAIEHGTLRARFNEPRIHLALVCAAKGCPPLRNEPYSAARLDMQLDDQGARFMGNTEKFRINRQNKTVYLSRIFEWFADDFSKAYGTNQAFGKHSAKHRGVLAFVSRYLPDRDREYLAKGDFSLSYLPYDWSLNER
jgi:hypothetical protein